MDAIDSEGVTFGSEKLFAHSVFWAAGVRGATLQLQPQVETDRAGRIKVTGDFSVPGHTRVFVVGDLALFEVVPGTYLPGLAPVAIQGGRHAANMIMSDLRQQPRRPFSYRDKGQMATIGRSRALAQTNHFALTGRLAWFAWLFVHIFFPYWFPKPSAVMSQWAGNYLFSRRESRLITQKEWRVGHRAQGAADVH